MTLEEIKEAGRTRLGAEEVIAELDKWLAEHPDDDEALTMRGMKYWSLGKRSLAMNDYMAAVRLNPESPARFAIRASYDVLNYYNKDLYNP